MEPDKWKRPNAKEEPKRKNKNITFRNIITKEQNKMCIYYRKYGNKTNKKYKPKTMLMTN